MDPSEELEIRGVLVGGEGAGAVVGVKGGRRSRLRLGRVRGAQGEPGIVDERLHVHRLRVRGFVDVHLQHGRGVARVRRRSPCNKKHITEYGVRPRLSSVTLDRYNRSLTTCQGLE